MKIARVRIATGLGTTLGHDLGFDHICTPAQLFALSDARGNFASLAWSTKLTKATKDTPTL